MAPRPKPLSDRFWPKVDKRGPDECWPWIGSRDSDDYGMIWVLEEGRPIKASRASWILHNGPIPADRHVLHRCDNPPCVNPEHLFLGTPADNTADMIAKGRRGQPKAVGERCSHAKLTEAQVRAIRADRRRQVDIASDYGVWQSAISAIKRRVNWSHLRDESGLHRSSYGEDT